VIIGFIKPYKFPFILKRKCCGGDGGFSVFVGVQSLAKMWEMGFTPLLHLFFDKNGGFFKINVKI